MTTTFYAPPEAFRGDYVTLPEDEARHAVRVLRHREGDEVEVVDGVGGWYRVRLEEVGKHEAAGRVVETRREVGEPAYRLTVGLGLLKNPSRFETFLEKAVELGVDTIVPLQTVRTEKARIKAQRAGNILIAAMKQSGRSRMPVLREAQSLDVIRQEEATLKLVCHEAAGADASIASRLHSMPREASVCILVGPEGGFTDDEVAQAQAAGFAVVSLGPRRLRAETAALTAAAAVMLYGTRS